MISPRSFRLLSTAAAGIAAGCKGQRLRVAVSNRLPADTSIHWHGIAIVNDMDGVPPLTQSAIPAGGNFTYDFAVADRRQKDREDHSRLVVVPRPLVN